MSNMKTNYDEKAENSEKNGEIVFEEEGSDLKQAKGHYRC